uniref:CDKN2A interacting protein n=1 Tax=Anser cygnoides TaxID=8845 RepID=A0A8B9E7V4_ANSCY
TDGTQTFSHFLVMEKALEMAEGIQVSDAPVRTTRDELVAKVKKRGISSSNEGVEEPSKKRAVEKSKDAKDTEKDVKTTEAESPKETESTLPKKQEKDSSRESESSQSACSSNQAAVAALSIEAEEKPVNAENTTEQSPTPSSSEKESGENPPKEGKCENEPSPEKTTLSSGPPAAAKSAPQAGAVPPAAAKSAPQAEAVPPAAAKSAPQAGAVPPAAKSAPQAAAVPATTAKSATQTSATLLSSKNQASATPSVSKSVAQAGASLLLAPKSAGSSLLASKSSAEVAASLLAARSGTQQGASLLTSKSSAQVAASLLAARSGSQQGPSRQLASKSSSQAGESPAKALCKPLTSEDAKERQPFFNRLYKAVAWKLVAVGGFSPSVNHAELLNSSIQSVKATLDVAFVPLKELADLPQNKSSLENIVCELRCKSVYLGTGCGKSMENAKAVASREALKLFLKKKVIVKICKRKYKGREIEDLVLLDEESKPSNLPPALRNPREIM